MIVAACWQNQNGTGSTRSAFGGPLGPTDTGWEWRYAGWVVDTLNAATKIAIDVRVETLNDDTLAQVRNKILAGIKASAQAQNLTPTVAVFDPMGAPVTIP